MAGAQQWGLISKNPERIAGIVYIDDCLSNKNGIWRKMQPRYLN